jgi:rhodanese-related sulfurtransferase
MIAISSRSILIYSLGGALLLATVASASSQGIKWTIVNFKVRHDFPTVRRIDSEHLSQWLGDAHRAQPILLDVRTKEEYDVSHLRGAQRVEPGSGATSITIPHEKSIVTYCSVGYRSAAFAKALQEAGFKNVQNLTGSIFDWANRGYPIEQQGHSVKKVHPYNDRWGGLLEKELRANVPPLNAGI